MTPAELTPSRIVDELSRYIIGQAAAKRAVAIALRNRWRRLQAPAELRREIVPNNILMIGATGVGKTEIARRLARLVDAPFVKVEASKFTEVGYVGRDVESMVRDLVEQAVHLVEAEHKARHRKRAEELAEDQLLDLLIPPVKEGDADQELNQATREKFREKLRRGDLDERQVELDVNINTNVQIMAPQGMEGLEGLQDMFQQMAPKRTKRRKLTVAEARTVLIEEEAGKLIDTEAVTKEAVERAQNTGMIFIDEVDKIAAKKGPVSSGDVSREGVQRDLLPIVEGSAVNTKYGTVNTDHILFIAAGAFHQAKPSDLIPELQGRFPIRVELQSLTREDFVKILRVPQNSLLKQYQALLQVEGVSLSFEDDAIEALADLAFQVNEEVENIGARRLHTVMSNLLEDVLFSTPDLNPDPAFTVTADYVHTKLSSLVQSRDLSHYIL